MRLNRRKANDVFFDFLEQWNDYFTYIICAVMNKIVPSGLIVLIQLDIFNANRREIRII